MEHINAYYQFKLMAPLVGIVAFFLTFGVVSLWQKITK